MPDDMNLEIPAQTQEKQPGRETEMSPQPIVIRDSYRGSGKLAGKKALITGGDSGIGRAVAVHFAREGADVAVAYLEEHEDAEETRRRVQAEGRQCILIAGDIGDPKFCEEAIARTARELGGLNILVNNAAEQHPQESIEDISNDQLEKTFRTNIFSMFYLTRAALKFMKEGDAIINTTSVTTYRGSAKLVDYASTKGAIVGFTRSLSEQLAEKKKIRVNAVAPGPIWTPLIPATFDEEKVASFGQNVPLGRPGQPAELGPAYVYLASEDASYVTGQVLHVNGGEVING